MRTLEKKSQAKLLFFNLNSDLLFVAVPAKDLPQELRPALIIPDI